MLFLSHPANDGAGSAVGSLPAGPIVGSLPAGSAVGSLPPGYEGYEGGRFEVGLPPPALGTRALHTPANSAVVFDHLAHRVTEVTRGCRRSLVEWATSRDVSQQFEACSSFE